MIKSPNEICLREKLGDLDEKIYNVVENWEIWYNASDSGNGKLKEFRKERNKIEKEIEQIIDFWIDKRMLTKILETEAFDHKIKKLEEERMTLLKTVKDLRGKKAQVISEIKAFKRIQTAR